MGETVTHDELLLRDPGPPVIEPGSVRCVSFTLADTVSTSERVTASTKRCLRVPLPTWLGMKLVAWCTGRAGTVHRKKYH